MRKRVFIIINLIANIACFPIFVQAGSYGWNKTKSPFKVEIKLKKDTYTLSEEVKGEVVISHIRPATLPGTFKVIVYQDGYKVTEHFTNIPTIPVGHTEFSFKSFGIPNMTDDAMDVGEWIIKIHPIHDESRTAKAKILVSALESQTGK